MLFSVTIPTYKSQYLKETIDSVLSQSYKDFELIIVNDASPDDIDSIVKQYDDIFVYYSDVMGVHGNFDWRKEEEKEDDRKKRSARLNDISKDELVNKK